MNNRNIQGIVIDFLEGNAVSEIIPCIFQVTLTAASPEPTLTITENQKQTMNSLLVFVLKLQNELNSPAKKSHEELMRDLDQIFKELEAALYNTGIFLDDTKSFEIMKRIRNFAVDYKALIDFINENVKA